MPVSLNSKLLLITIIIITSCCNLLIGQPSSWTISNGSDINWYQKTSYGVTLVSTDKSILGIYPKEKKIIWELANLPKHNQENFAILDEVPLMSVGVKDTEKKGGGFFKSFSLGPRFPREHFYNYLNGDLILDTKDAGIDYLTDVVYYPDCKSVLLQGFSGDTGFICCHSLIKREKLWQITRPGTPGKNGSPAILYITADVQQNFILYLADTIYQLSGTTGKTLWSVPKPAGFKAWNVSDQTPFLFALANDTLLRIQTQTGITDKSFALPGLFIKETTPNSSFQNTSQYNNLYLHDTLLAMESNTSFWIMSHSIEKVYSRINFDKISPLRLKDFFALPDGSVAILSHYPNQTDKAFFIRKFEKTNRMAWKDFVYMHGNELKKVFLHNGMLIFVSDRDIKMVDDATGAEKKPLGVPIPKIDSSFLFAENPSGTQLCIYFSGKMYKLDYKTMEISVLINNIDFKGSDPEDKTPLVLEGLENGWHLAAGQNITLIDYNDKVVYNHYYEKPGTSRKTLRLITGLAGVAAGFIFRDQASLLSNAFYRSGEMNTDAYLNIVALDYGTRGAGSALLTGAIAADIIKDTKANISRLQKEGSSYELIFSKQNGDLVMLQIDKKTGETLMAIPMSSKKQIMETDVLNRGLFTINEDGKTFEYYLLK